MEFSVLTWNVEGRKHYTSTKFSKIVPWLEKYDADIMCLQEIPDWQQKIPLLPGSDKLTAVSPRNAGTNHNLILSHISIQDAGEIEFSEVGIDGSEEALWADISVGKSMVRIYNCHLDIIGVGIKERTLQFEHILRHARSHAGPAIIAGDMNTTIPQAGWERKAVEWFHREPDESMYIKGSYIAEDERQHFSHMAEKSGFEEVFDLRLPTWRIAPLRWQLFDLKLDWFLTRGVGVLEKTLGPYISDHRPLRVRCKA